jgi:predicted RNA methylase
MRRILKSKLDKFYTKSSISIDLINRIDLSRYQLVIDPCCGDGSFYSNIFHNNKIGIDILPNIDGVISHDFLTWDYSSIINIPSKNILCISNPPFGKQGSLAMKFIKRCSEFSDTIAFILPLSFSKPSFKNKIPEYFHLQYEEVLPENSFLLDGNEYSVKCVFQIWEKRDYLREKIKVDKEIGFSYTKVKSIADISVRRVGVYAGKTSIDIDKSEQSHYFIILDSKPNIDKVVNLLNKHKWIDLTVGPRSISKGELNKVLNNILI